MPPGSWPSVTWPGLSWPIRSWPTIKRGITPYPLDITVAHSLEYKITITQSGG